MVKAFDNATTLPTGTIAATTFSLVSAPVTGPIGVMLWPVNQVRICCFCVAEVASMMTATLPLLAMNALSAAWLAGTLLSRLDWTTPSREPDMRS